MINVKNGVDVVSCKDLQEEWESVYRCQKVKKKGARDDSVTLSTPDNSWEWRDRER